MQATRRATLGARLIARRRLADCKLDSLKSELPLREGTSKWNDSNWRDLIRIGQNPFKVSRASVRILQLPLRLAHLMLMFMCPYDCCSLHSARPQAAPPDGYGYSPADTRGVGATGK